jgi:hypothetical protein
VIRVALTYPEWQRLERRRKVRGFLAAVACVVLVAVLGCAMAGFAYLATVSP